MIQSMGVISADDVRGIFTRIAARYDLLNRLMTFGRDRAWRRETIRRLNLQPGERLLDLGTGTGSLAYEALHQIDELRVVACDFTPQMINIGRMRSEERQPLWVIADAHFLPFTRGTFNAIVSGFLLRNVLNLDAALREQVRILHRNGRMASLDTTPPPTGILYPLLKFFLHRIIPLLGDVFAGDRAAYHYLPETTTRFLPAETLADRMREAGLAGIHFTRRMFGTIAIHWANKSHRGRYEKN